jgi:hypothetical protein
MKREICTRKVDMGDELLACIFYAAARTKKRTDKHRRTTRDLRTVAAKCCQVAGRISEHLSRAVINLSFKHQIKIN